jgi:hypothetical protein
MNIVAESIFPANAGNQPAGSPLKRPEEATPGLGWPVGSQQPANDGAAAVRILDVSKEARRIQQIAEWLRLLIQPGDVVELRALAASTLEYRRLHTESGFFDHDHLDAMADAAYRLTHDAQGVYFTLNPLNPDVLARRSNRVEAAADGTARDVDVDRRCRLLIDADPVRISGVSATDDEKEKAREVIEQVRTFLRERGWPEPFFADSGNGFHLLFDVDLPADDGELIKRVLAALATKFDTPAARIDCSVFNASRIVKLYGTLARKGDSTPDRPHRWTSILEVPADRRVVAKELLEQLASEGPAAQPPAKSLSPSLPLQGGSSAATRARSYLDKMPGAVAGDSGHNRTFTAANVLVRGFGLTVPEALPILKEWNQKCQPLWSETRACPQAGRRGQRTRPTRLSSRFVVAS